MGVIPSIFRASSAATFSSILRCTPAIAARMCFSTEFAEGLHRARDRMTVSGRPRGPHRHPLATSGRCDRDRDRPSWRGGGRGSRPIGLRPALHLLRTLVGHLLRPNIHGHLCRPIIRPHVQFPTPLPKSLGRVQGLRRSHLLWAAGGRCRERAREPRALPSWMSSRASRRC